MNILNLTEVTCAVPLVHLANPEANAGEITDIIGKHPDSSVILFPELCITGYTCGDLFFQKRLLEESLRALDKIRAKTEEDYCNQLVVVGLPLLIEQKLYNVAAVINNGHIAGIVPKIYIPENREFYEKRWFRSGEDLTGDVNILNERVPVSADLIFRSDTNPDLKVAVEICEDLWAPRQISIELAEAGATVILNPSASNETIQKAGYREQLVLQQSARLNCAYLYASAGFGESTQDLVFGGEAIIAEKGVLLKKGERFLNHSHSISAQIDLDLLVHDRKVQSSFQEREFVSSARPSVEVSLLEPGEFRRFYPKNPFVPGEIAERRERSEEILNIQTQGLATRIKHLNNPKMVVGVSGGLDSTLALIVAKRTADYLGLDPKNVIAVTMPGFGTTDRTYRNALRLIGDLGAELREIPIGEAVKMHLKSIGHPLSRQDETYENAQARERTQILMDLANQENGIVVGTGDLSELALGWATYNGDHMSMYGVNSGIPKTLVRYLIDYYAETNEELKPVLRDILDTPVSPELLPPDEEGNIKQKTEERIGPYELHDFFLYHFVRNGFTPGKILRIATETFKDEYEEETILKWLKVFIRRFFSQQFKRSTLPDGPKVGSVSLSPRGDWRMPTDARVEAFLGELD